jgi:hypothetical protein
MSDPALQPTTMPIVLGQSYTISSLFTYIPGTGPNGESVIGVRANFYPEPNEVFTGISPDVSGLDDYQVYGDISGLSPSASWSTGTVTLTALPGTTL